MKLITEGIYRYRRNKTKNGPLFFWSLKKIWLCGLHQFAIMIHNPTIHNTTMHSVYINYISFFAYHLSLHDIVTVYVPKYSTIDFSKNYAKLVAKSLFI